MDKHQFVYVIAHCVNGVLRAPVKVGVSANPQKRLMCLQIGCPEQLVVVHAFNVPDRDWALRTETAFKAINANKGMRGEWFDMNPIEAVASIGFGLMVFITENGGPCVGGNEILELMRRSGVYCVSVDGLEPPSVEERDGRSP